MLWKTHRRIGMEVLKRLNLYLPKGVFQSYMDGLIYPDKLGQSDFPHHYGKTEKIKQLLLKSRAHYLIDDKTNAYFCLGNALHYIQDSYTSMASFYPKHHEWEKAIECCSFNDDLFGTINYSLRNERHEKTRCLELASILSQKAVGKKPTLYMSTLTGRNRSNSFAEPMVDLNLALRASYIVSESVLSSKTNPQLDSMLNLALSNNEKLLWQAELNSSNKIVKRAIDTQQLRDKISSKSGFKAKLNNALLIARIKVKELQMRYGYYNYSNKKHLLAVESNYRAQTSEIVKPHLGWYNFSIPQLNITSIQSELIPLKKSDNEINRSYRITRNLVLVRRRDQQLT
jgi:hypothetical protein